MAAARAPLRCKRQHDHVVGANTQHPRHGEVFRRRSHLEPKSRSLEEGCQAQASTTMVVQIVMICRSGMRAPKISTGRLRLDHRSMDFGRLE